MMHIPNGNENNLLSKYGKLYAKFEPIVTKTLEIYSNEILFRIDSKSNSHIDVLNDLRKNNETFDLFVKISRKAFEVVKNTGIGVNINLEVDDILNTYFLSYLELLLSLYNIDPKKINFELVECSDIKDGVKEKIVSKIKIISDMGFLFSIDDLYSGYSNKQRINFLQSEGIGINTVKVDGKFLRDMYDSYRAGFAMPDIIKYDGKKYFKYSLNDFSDFKNYIGELHNKGIKIVAEWIENEEMFNFAIELGFDYFQGYYIQNLNKNLQEI